MPVPKNVMERIGDVLIVGRPSGQMWSAGLLKAFFTGTSLGIVAFFVTPKAPPGHPAPLFVPLFVAGGMFLVSFLMGALGAWLTVANAQLVLGEKGLAVQSMAGWQVLLWEELGTAWMRKEGTAEDAAEGRIVLERGGTPVKQVTISGDFTEHRAIGERVLQEYTRRTGSQSTGSGPTV